MRGSVATVLIKAQTEYAARIASKRIYPELGPVLIKTAVIARSPAHDAKPPEPAGKVGVTQRNCVCLRQSVGLQRAYRARVSFETTSKRAGLFQGELRLDANAAQPLRLWGDLVKSPAIFIRSFRFVHDYRTVAGRSQPLRLPLVARTRIAGKAKMAQGLAGGQPELTRAVECNSRFSTEVKHQNENRNR